jgi:outer membrane protein OmpA-like peptidoglycan-associated protein
MDGKIVAVFLAIALFLITPVPMIGSITPDYGLNNQIVDVTIRGEKFDNKSTIKLVKPGEPDIVATDVRIISKKQIRCSFDLRGQAAGEWNVIVTNKNPITKKFKAASLAGGFTIQYPAPTIAAIDPNHGLSSEAVSTHLIGAGFRAGAKVILNKDNQDIKAVGVTVISASQITAGFNLADAESGTYDVKVINDDGKAGILKNGFMIGNPAPEVTAVKPNQGIVSEIITLMITGNNFKSGAKAVLDDEKQVIEISRIKVLSGTQISSELNLADVSPGVYNVTVTNDDGQSGTLSAGFQVKYPAPTVTGIEPKQGLNTETLTVNLSGTSFRAGAKVELLTGDQTIEASDVEVLSDTRLVADFNLVDAVPGNYDVKVTNDDGQSGTLSAGFQVKYPAPTVTGIEPKQGLNTETLTVNLSGTSFRAGAKVELLTGDQTIEASDVEVLSDTRLVADFNLVDAVPGNYDVKVTNDDGQSGTLSAGFQVEYPAPTVTGIEPKQGLNTETLTVNLSGTSFRAGAKVELLTGDQTIEASDVEVLSDTRLVADFNLVDAVPGNYDVKVTNDDGQSGTLAGGFRIIVKPTIRSVIPAEGFNNGSLLAEINGANFQAGALTKLTGPGRVEIPGLNIKIKGSTKITCFFDLNKKPVGSYNVVVVNPDGQEARLPAGFKVKEYIPTNQELNALLKPVFFDFDKAELRADQIPVLEKNVKILNENSKLYILLGGHADERGTQEYNLDLTQRRAEAVKEFLLAKGVDSAKISIYAYGKDYPVRKGHDESSWWYNRRADVLVWESPPTREQGLIKVLNSDGESDESP